MSFGRVGTEGNGRAVQQFDISFPRDVEPLANFEGGVNLSPNGSVVALTGVKNGERSTFIRRLDSDTPVAVRVPGTGITGSAF